VSETFCNTWTQFFWGVGTQKATTALQHHCSSDQSVWIIVGAHHDHDHDHDPAPQSPQAEKARQRQGKGKAKARQNQDKGKTSKNSRQTAPSSVRSFHSTPDSRPNSVIVV